MILIVAMIIIFAVAALTLTLGAAMRVESAVAANVAAEREASVIARGAEQYVLGLLEEARLTGEPVELLNETYYEAVQIGGGMFWIVRPDYFDPQLPAFGLVDESSKLDLNHVSYQQLLRIPGMPQELAASIVDWRDEDEEPTDGLGAESQVYLSRNPGYAAKNAPFESVEELLLVHGMTRDLLYGPQPQPPLGTGSAAAGTINPGGGAFGGERYLVRGFNDYFTVWSTTPTTAPDGRERLDVDGEEGPLEDLVEEIIGGSRAAEINSRLNDEDNIFEFALDAGITADELAQLEPYLIAGNPAEDNVNGRINLNAAPRDVLLAIEALDEAKVEALLSRRPAAVLENPASMAWVMEVLDQEAESLGTGVIAQGGHYSADIVAVSGDGRAFRRVRIVVDATAAPVRIVYRRDLTERGWPLDPTLLEMLRRNEGLAYGLPR